MFASLGTYEKARTSIVHPRRHTRMLYCSEFVNTAFEKQRNSKSSARNKSENKGKTENVPEEECS